MELGKIKKSLIDFARNAKNEENWKAKQYLEKKQEIFEEVEKLKSLDGNLHLT